MLMNLQRNIDNFEFFSSAEKSLTRVLNEILKIGFDVFLWIQTDIVVKVYFEPVMEKHASG